MIRFYIIVVDNCDTNLNYEVMKLLSFLFESFNPFLSILLKGGTFLHGIRRKA